MDNEIKTKKPSKLTILKVGIKRRIIKWLEFNKKHYVDICLVLIFLMFIFYGIMEYLIDMNRIKVYKEDREELKQIVNQVNDNFDNINKRLDDLSHE